MKIQLRSALILSLFVHTIILIGIIWWSLHNTGLLGGGGGGVVEVAVVGSGNGSTPVRPEPFDSRPFALSLSKRERTLAQDRPVEGRMARASTSSARTEQNTVPFLLAASQSEAGDGEAGAGSSGEGVGSGTGPGDPRLVAIWKKINRSKYYPEMARRQGAEGAPKVAFSISEDGKVDGVKVVESSGNEILDRAAVEAIQNSAPLPFYPQQITIAVRYSLKGH